MGEAPAAGAPAVAFPWSNPGFCVACEHETIFRAYGPWLRDTYVCSRCGASPRTRSLIHHLNLLCPAWRTASLHESSPSDDSIARRCSGYSSSFYLDGVLEGSIADGRRCENLEHLTFPSESFDVFVTQDVLEHVFDPGRALAEIVRVLKPGGTHVFTTPKHPGVTRSYARARLSGAEIEHLHPAEYHCNPVNDGRALVTWDFGSDFETLVRAWTRYNVSTYVLRDRHLGIDGEYLEVFANVKNDVNFLFDVAGNPYEENASAPV